MLNIFSPFAYPSSDAFFLMDIVGMRYACQHQPTSRAMSSTRPTARGLHDVGPHPVTGQERRAWQEEIFQLHQELAVLGTYETKKICLVYW